jgi:hypothetical protein
MGAARARGKEPGSGVPDRPEAPSDPSQDRHPDAVTWLVAWRGVTSRLPIARILLVLAALTGVLTGCRRDVSSAAPSAAGTPAAGRAHDSSAAGSPAATSTGAATTSTCPEEIATDTYVRATSARAAGDVVVITAHPARRVCGGPDNSHYEVDAATERVTLTASTTVVLITTTPSGLGHETVAPADLPQRLVDDRFGRIFLVRGPLTGVTSMEEQYHP